jgi:hypothetical protein
VTYWVLALVLTVFGFLTGFSIGAPFLLLGLALLVLGPLRRRPRIFWPALVAVTAFVLTVALLIPLSCVATSEAGGGSSTVCTSIAGPTWSGTGIYNPPREAYQMPVRYGTVVAIGAALTTLALLTVRQRRGPSGLRSTNTDGSQDPPTS